MKKTASEILKIVSENIGIAEFCYEYNRLDKLGLGKIKEIEQKGGEDQGSEWHIVLYFVDHDVYIKVNGYYSSYDGVDFDDYGKEVRPKEKTITVYE